MRRKVLLAAFVILALLAGCSGGAGRASDASTAPTSGASGSAPPPPAPDPAPPPPVPAAVALTASSYSVFVGDAVLLTYSTSADPGGCVTLMTADGVTSPWPSVAVLPPDVSGTALSGALQAPTTFTLECNGAASVTTASVAIAVSSPAPPGPPAPPTMSLTASPSTVQSGQAAVLIWASQNATACYGAQVSPYDPPWPDPNGDVEPITGSINTPPLTVTSRYSMVCSNAGGNAEASTTITVQGSAPPPTTCVPPQVLINGVCQNPPSPTFTITPNANPTAIVDSSGCPADYNGTPCRSSVTITDSLGSESTDSCTMNGGMAQPASVAWLIGPIATDGPVVLNFSCTSAAPLGSQTATASITVTVVPPYVPPPDTFSVAGSDPYTFTWSTTSKAGQGGCSVFLASSTGPFTTPTALVPGGTPAGSATSAFLSSAYDPWTAQLVCSGVPDPGVPALQVNP